MTPHILYDNRRSERWEPLMGELDRQGIKGYVIYQPVWNPDSVIKSINLSHKAIVRMAKNYNLPRVCVFEDDICFPHPEGWKRFLEDIPDDFDIYLGGTYGIDRPVVNPISQINGFHCYIMDSRFYDTFLSIPDNVHCDTALDGLGVFYVHYPFVAVQKKGWSANCMASSDKNADLTDADVYGGLPQ